MHCVPISTPVATATVYPHVCFISLQVYKPFITNHHLNLFITIMEVVVTESGQLEFSNLTRHCVLHAVYVLAPHGIHAILPASGSHKIKTFCRDLSGLVKSKSTKKGGLEDILMPTLEVHRFYEGAISMEDFTMLIEKRILETSGENVDVESLQRLCWQYYATERKGDITYPKWLSPECTYRLWTIFNCVLDRKLTVCLPQLTVNEVLKRLLELCGYTWNEKYGYNKQEALEFPDYLDTITSYFDKLKLETSLTCEVIADMVDEIVHGVLRKGYLTKKGHKVKSWKRRWFVLRRTILQYFKSREKLQLKVGCSSFHPSHPSLPPLSPSLPPLSPSLPPSHFPPFPPSLPSLLP